MNMGAVRLRLVIQRHGVPDVNLVWPCTASDNLTIAKLLSQVNEVVPLESGEWGLEDYAVQLGDGNGNDAPSFDCLHFQLVSRVLKDEDQVFIRPLLSDDLKRRRLSGRLQISNGGKHLVDGVAFGRPWLRLPTDRPALDLPPRKRARLTYGDEADQQDSSEDAGSEFDADFEELQDQEDAEHASRPSSHYEHGARDELRRELALLKQDQVDAEHASRSSSHYDQGEQDELRRELALLQQDHRDSFHGSSVNDDVGFGLLPTLDSMAALRLAFPEISSFVIQQVLRRQKHNIKEAYTELCQSYRLIATLSFDEMMDAALTTSRPSETLAASKTPATSNASAAAAGLDSLGQDLSVQPICGRRLIEVVESDGENANEKDTDQGNQVAALYKTYETESDSDSDSDDDSLELDAKSHAPGVNAMSLLSSDSDDDSSSDGLTSDSDSDSKSESESESDSDSEPDSLSKPDSLSESDSLSDPESDPDSDSDSDSDPDSLSDSLSDSDLEPPRQSSNSSAQLKQKLVQNISSESESDSSDDSSSESEADPAPRKKPVKRQSVSKMAQVSASTPVVPTVQPGSGLSRTQKRNARRKRNKMMRNLANASEVDEDSTPNKTTPSLAACKALLLQSLGIEPVESEKAAIKSVTPQASNDEVANKEATLSANHDQAASPTTRRRDVDNGASRRLLFGALGLKVPKTKADEEKLKKDLMKGVRPLMNRRLIEQERQVDQQDGSVEEDNWRDKINYRAVECCFDGVLLSEPPFPFQQRWDPQQQYKSTGKRKRQTQEYHEETVSAKKSRTGKKTAAEDGPLTNGDAITVDLPPLPVDISSLAALEQSGVEAGLVITWKQLSMSKATNWQPEMVSLTGVVLAGSDEKEVKMMLAKRDRETKEHVYDEETGQRVYDKFEVPVLDEEEDEGEDDGHRTVAWCDMMEPRIIPGSAPAGFISMMNGVDTATVEVNGEEEDTGKSQPEKKMPQVGSECHGSTNGVDLMLMQCA